MDKKCEAICFAMSISVSLGSSGFERPSLEIWQFPRKGRTSACGQFKRYLINLSSARQSDYACGDFESGAAPTARLRK